MTMLILQYRIQPQPHAGKSSAKMLSKTSHVTKEGHFQLQNNCPP